MPDGADLEHHHADGVGDDVVQFARDPHTLLGHCDPRRRVPFPLGQARAYFRRLGLLGTLAQSEARHPADRELERDEDEHGGCVAGDLVDDGRRPADHQSQADACLHGVAQVPEQERGYQPDHEDADRERDQAPIDERDPRRQQPVRRWREGKPPTRNDREHQDRDRRKDEPQRRARRVGCMTSDQHFEHRGDQQERDQEVDDVGARQVSDPPHALKVLHACARRLLPG